MTNFHRIFLGISIVIVCLIFNDAQGASFRRNTKKEEPSNMPDARKLSQYSPFTAYISKSFTCDDTVQVTVTAPDARYFVEKNMDLRRLIGPVRVQLVSKCSQLKQIDVIGLAGNKKVYQGRAMASKKWVLFKVPAQHPGKKGITINKQDELIVYQDKGLTIKGPSLNYASSWCEAGLGFNKSLPLNIRAFYSVDHLERDSLFSPGYAAFVQKNIVPAVKDYCGRVPSNIEMTMMEPGVQSRFWDILTFSVVNGKVVGKRYMPPASSTTQSLDQEKLKAFIKKMAVAQNDLKRLEAEARAKKNKPDVPVKSGRLRRYRNMTSHTDFFCNGKVQNLYIQTKLASVYEGGKKDLQTLVDAERLDRLKTCPKVKTFIINGALKGKWYFRGVSSKADNWIIKGQLIKNDEEYLEPYMFPEAPDEKYKLGLMYFSGKRLALDEYKAAENIKDAANQGHAEAQFLLGLFYEKGIGVKKHQYHALKWIRKAADQGLLKARQHLEQYEKNEKLAEQERIRAEKAARRKGIVYKSGRFWQEFSNFEVVRKVFDGQFSGLDSRMDFKNYFIDFDQGRTASYLTAPSQIAACGFPAQSSSILFASYKNIINILFAIPRSEVGKRYRPFLSVLVSFAGSTIPSSPSPACPAGSCDRPYRLRVL